MSKFIKALSATLTASLVLLAAAGCGGSNNNDQASPETSATASQTETQAPTSSGPDLSEEVKLKIYTVSDPAPGHDDVVAAINKITKEKINTTVEIENIPWASLGQKYPLIFSANEEFDGVYAANWMGYGAYALKGAFMEITPDMQQQYLPDVMKELPEDAWKQTKINGKIYMVPTTWNEFLVNSFTVRGDLREKYGVGPINNLDDFEKYLAAIKKNEPTMVPFDVSSLSLGMIYDLFVPSHELASLGGTPLYYKFTDNTVNAIENIWEDPAFKDFLKKMKSWRDAGYWTRDAMMSKTDTNQSFANGKSASDMYNENAAIGMFYTSWKTAHPDWKLELWDATGDAKVLGTAYIGSGFAVHATSKHADRALMLANLARTDKTLNQLFVNGIEGTHYKNVGDNKFELIADAPKPYSRDTDGTSFMFRNSNYQFMTANVFPSYETISKGHAAKGVTSPWQAFNFDPKNVENEIAKVTEVLSQETPMLLLGYADDVDKALDSLNAKLKAAGMDKIKEEVLKQANEFISNYK